MGEKLEYKFFSVEGDVPVGDHGEELTIRFYPERPKGRFLELYPVTPDAENSNTNL
jgi:hypothetical protein